MKKTQKLNVLPPTEQNSWLEAWENHPIIHWIVSNGKMLLYAVLGLILLTFLVFRFLVGGGTTSQADFLNAEKEYRLFSAPPKEGYDSTIQKNALENLNKIIKAHPELHAKYDGSIAEILLIRAENSLAIDYALPAIQRTTEENDPFYHRYAQITLTIADFKFDQALKDSITLKDQMLEQGKNYEETPEKIQFSTILYALNLLRIGMLQQKLAFHTDELKTWQEWKDLVRKSHVNTLPKYLDGQLFIAFDNILAEGNVTFADYINAREKISLK